MKLLMKLIILIRLYLINVFQGNAWPAVGREKKTTYGGVNLTLFFIIDNHIIED